MIPKIAILGANGFVGSRLIERFHLGGVAELRPVVRSYGGLARLARFELDWRMADGRDTAALASAFADCDAVVNLVAADPRVIVENAIASYEAAQLAGVKRLVFMSSAAVHGLAPAPGTDESSAIHSNHDFAYNNAKVHAERALFSLRAKGSVELVVLRPSIILGPRSRWVSEIASQLLAGTAWLTNEGQGICNSIYVDNLVDAIRQAVSVSAADREVFLVGDRERVTWLDLYRAIAQALGLSDSGIAWVNPPQFPRRGWRQKLGDLKATAPVQAVLPWFSPRLKESVKASIGTWNAPPLPSQWALPGVVPLAITEEMCALQSCQWQLPSAKAARQLGYDPAITFFEGMRRCAGWLEFAGLSTAAPR